MPQPYLRTKMYPIYQPSKGMIDSIPPTELISQACSDCQNVRFYDQITEKRKGYVDYEDFTGVGGTPIKFYRYQEIGGTEHEILATTTHIYNNDSNVWTAIDDGAIGCDIDNRISLSTMYKSSKFYLIISSRDYTAHKWDGTTYNDVGEATTFKPKIMLPYQFRLLMFNIDEGGTDIFPVKFRYSSPTDFEDWTTAGSAGSRNMIQGAGSEIMNAVPIGNSVGVYKDLSITMLNYVGGSSIFATTVPIDGIGLAAQDCIVNLGTYHLFLGSDLNFHKWTGGGELTDIGNPIVNTLRDEINKAKVARCFAVKSEMKHEAHFFIATGSNDYPTRIWTYNWVDKTWAKNTITSCSGGGTTKVAWVERVLLGLSAGGIEHYDYSTTNDNGAAIDSWFIPAEVVITQDEYILQMKDFRRVVVDAKGNKLAMEYSTDEGENYSTIDEDSLTSTSYYNINKFDFAKAAGKIRFKFSNDNTSETYAVRFIGIEYKERERK